MGEKSGPAVSIGIPVFNGERFIEQAIESVRAQTFGDWELIVSDNGSNDATPSICRRLASLDTRIRYVHAPVNRGAAWNFNRVFGLGRGAYFKWLAADDLCAPRFLEEAVAALQRVPHADLAYSPGVFVNALGTPLYDGLRFSTSAAESPRASVRGKALLQSLLQDGRAAQVLIFGLARRDALARVRALGAYYAADWTLTMDLLLRAPAVELPAELVFFRRHEASSSAIHRLADPSAQQAFYDPAVQQRSRVMFNYRRRDLELARSFLNAPISPLTRAGFLATLVSSKVRPLVPRAATHVRSTVRGFVRNRFA